MGIYVYVTKPSHVATAVVEINGVQSETEVALYRYAYKPYGGWHRQDHALNARMRFKSGAQACIAAYARSDKALPAYGVFFDGERMEVYAAGRSDANGVFGTKGDVEVYDDMTKTVGKVVRWVKLPKGIKQGAMPMDKRLTPTTVLEYAPRALSESVPGADGWARVSYWARLADRATGEHQPEWRLCGSAEALQALAERYGVPMIKAAEGAR